MWASRDALLHAVDSASRARGASIAVRPPANTLEFRLSSQRSVMPPHAQQPADTQVGGFTAAPSTSHFVEAGGLKFHYLDYGTAGLPPMLCIHGGAGHAHWYDFVAPGFNKDYHVLSLDLRGHGD